VHGQNETFSRHWAKMLQDAFGSDFGVIWGRFGVDFWSNFD